MKPRLKLFILLALLFLLWIIYSCFFQLNSQYGVIQTRFEKPIRTLVQGGIYFKYPWPIDRLYWLDLRTQNYQTPLQEWSTKDDKILLVSAFLQWKVIDLNLFLKRIGELNTDAITPLALTLNQQLKSQLSHYTYDDLFSPKSGLRQLNAQLQAQLNAITEEKYGIMIIATGFLELRLPETTQHALIERQIASYEKQTALILEKARQEAKKIQTTAEIEQLKIRTAAEKEASQIKADGQKKADIYFNVYNRNKPFAKFIWKLRAAEESTTTQTSLILDQDFALFNFLKSDSELDNAK